MILRQCFIDRCRSYVFLSPIYPIYIITFHYFKLKVVIMTSTRNLEHAVYMYLHTTPPLPFQPLRKSTNNFFDSNINMYMHTWSVLAMFLYILEVHVQMQKALQFLCMKGNNSHFKI